MNFREHRGNLVDSMATAREIAPTIDALRGLVGSIGFDASTIVVEKYGPAVDDRIGWDTHIVTADYQGSGRAVCGFTDGPLAVTA